MIQPEAHKLLEEKAQQTYEDVRMRFPGHESTPINPATGLPERFDRRSLNEVVSLVKETVKASSVGPDSRTSLEHTEVNNIEFMV